MQRTLRVDHVKDYRPPDQDDENVDDVTNMVRAEGVAPRPLTPTDSEDDFMLPMQGKGMCTGRKTTPTFLALHKDL